MLEVRRPATQAHEAAAWVTLPARVGSRCAAVGERAAGAALTAKEDFYSLLSVRFAPGARER
jgi:hypothetical protein